MTKRKSKSTKSTVKAAAAKRSVTKSSAVPATAASPTLIVLGFDDRQKPVGARFEQDKPNLVIKAAELMGLKVYSASHPEVAAIAKKLPVGAPVFQVQGGSVLAGKGTVVDHGRTDRGRRQSHRAGGCPNSQ